MEPDPAEAKPEVFLHTRDFSELPSWLRCCDRLRDEDPIAAEVRQYCIVVELAHTAYHNLRALFPEVEPRGFAGHLVPVHPEPAGESAQEGAVICRVITGSQRLAAVNDHAAATFQPTVLYYPFNKEELHFAVESAMDRILQSSPLLIKSDSSVGRSSSDRRRSAMT